MTQRHYILSCMGSIVSAKRSFLLILFLMTLVLPSHAVLKEKDLDTTLIILRSELVTYHRELEQRNQRSDEEQKQMRQELFSILNQANQNSLMLYSQKQGYIFDLTYACHEATEQFKEFKKKSMPFRTIMGKMGTELARYDSLIMSLNDMPVKYMTPSAQVNRNVCLTLAVSIRRMLTENQEQLQTYIRIYDFTEKRLKTLNDYANKRYAEIQQSIFVNGNANYFQILSQLGGEVDQTKDAVVEKYRPSRGFVSQWDIRVITILFFAIVFFAVLSGFINIVIIRLVVSNLIRKGHFNVNKEQFKAKRPCIILAMTVALFAAILGIMQFSSHQNFLVMASRLLVEFAWLMAVILVSLLLRVDGKMITSAFRIYSPLMLMGFIVISFRIILIPNDLISLVFPPVLLVFAIWQWNVIHRHHKKVPRNDMFYAWTTLLVFIVSVVASWMGYTLLSVQILIWWVMQLTCILTITCIADWLKVISERKQMDQKPATQTWFFDFIYRLLLPTAGVLSIVVSIYWAADVFNLSDTTWMVFNQDYINTDYIKISLFGLCQIVVLYFAFRYVYNLLRSAASTYFQQHDPTTAASRMTMTKNILQVIVWGTYLMLALMILHINNTWLVVISGGLSTGIGFAMKDILENIYYGISLMAGRVKVGDYIICDGIRGKVSSITYTSTMIEAIDGSVIAFQNSQLFTKNYKNMTKNHGYELDILEVGVAYGTDIAYAKKVITDALAPLKCIYKKRPAKVVLRGLDDSCVTLKILVWVNVLTQYGDDGEILETVYNALNKAKIEIPFPQREITIKHVDGTGEEVDVVKK